MLPRLAPRRRLRGLVRGFLGGLALPLPAIGSSISRWPSAVFLPFFAGLRGLRLRGLAALRWRALAGLDRAAQRIHQVDDVARRLGRLLAFGTTTPACFFCSIFTTASS